jgi:hypothetical protein
MSSESFSQESPQEPSFGFETKDGFETIDMLREHLAAMSVRVNSELEKEGIKPIMGEE